jgi:hypothetical protein
VAIDHFLNSHRSSNQPLDHQAQQFLHADPMRFHLVRPGDAFECRVVEPENEVMQIMPAFRTIEAMNAVDLLDLLEPP